MSAYITRYCETHGDWDMDVDNPGSCPQCPDPLVVAQTRIRELEAKLLSEAKEWHCVGCTCSVPQRREQP